MLEESRRSDDKRGSEHLVACPRDDTEPALSRSRMIFRRQPHPCRKLATRCEEFRRWRFHHQQGCPDRPDTGDLSQATATLVGGVPCHQLIVDGGELLVQLPVFLGMRGEEFPREGRYGWIDGNAVEQRLDLANPLGRGEPEFGCIASKSPIQKFLKRSSILRFAG